MIFRGLAYLIVLSAIALHLYGSMNDTEASNCILIGIWMYITNK